MKRLIAVIIGLAIVFLIANQLINNKKKLVAEQQPKKNQNDQIAVTVANVVERKASYSFSVVGTLKGYREARILSQSQGRLLKLNVELGARVTQGQLIATTDNNLQEIAILTASNNLAKANADLERYKQLYTGGAATEQKFFEIQTIAKNAQTALDQARKQFNDASIKAPFSGTVISKDVEEGSFVNIGNLIATIIDVSRLKVLMMVPENQVYGISEGQEVIITADVTPGQKYKGKITFISPKGDDSHNYPVEILLENNFGTKLKAGTFVTATFQTNSNGNVKVIPRKSLVSGTADGKVFVVENKLAHLKSVLVLREAGDSVEVAKGLNAGETVVTTGQLNLKEGSKVNIIK